MPDDVKALQQPNPWIPERDVISLAVLGKLGEELGECMSAKDRCLIQGIDECEPVTGKLNREWLEDEIADVLATAAMAIEHFRLDEDRIEKRATRKDAHFRGWHRLLKAGAVTGENALNAIRAAWSELAAANHGTPIALQDGVLVVRVPSVGDAGHLTFMELDIVQRLSVHGVKQLRLRVAREGEQK